MEEKYSAYLQGKKINNIFKYIIPKLIYIPNNRPQRTIDLLCDFRFDIEHGIAIIFENEELINIVSQMK